MGVRGEILVALAERLGTITAANGYSTNVNKVYYDKIPMGIRLASYKLPAIFLLERLDPITNQHKQLQGATEYDLQLWHNDGVGDVEMDTFVGDVFKAIYADSATAQREDQFRSLHPKLVIVRPISIAGDLNMIDANRIYEVSFSVEYRCKFYEL